MPLYTRAQFAELCKLNPETSRPYLSTNIKRGKIILTDDGYIDDSNPTNKYFLAKCIDKADKAPAPAELNVKELSETENQQQLPVSTETQSESVENKITTPKTESKRSRSSEGGSKYDLDIEKKELEIEKLKVDTRLQELKEEKIRGEVLPISLTKGIVMALHQSIITSQKDSLEYLLIRISKEAQLSGEQLARLRGEMIKSLNEGAEKAIKAGQKRIKLLTEEFSIKKEVGEHD